MCRHLVTHVAAAGVYRHSNFADAAGRWGDKEMGGAGEFLFSTVLGLEGPTSRQSALMHYFIQLFK